MRQSIHKHHRIEGWVLYFCLTLPFASLQATESMVDLNGVYEYAIDFQVRGHMTVHNENLRFTIEYRKEGDAAFANKILEDSVAVDWERSGAYPEFSISLTASDDGLVLRSIRLHAVSSISQSDYRYMDFIFEGIPYVHYEGDTLLYEVRGVKTQSHIQEARYFEDFEPAYKDFNSFNRRTATRFSSDDDSYLRIELKTRPPGPVCRIKNEKTAFFTLKKKGAALSLNDPTLSFELERIDWAQLNINPNEFCRPESLVLRYAVTLTGQNNLTQYTVTQTVGSRPFALPGYQWKEGGLYFSESLHDIIERFGPDPYAWLARRHFNADTMRQIPGPTTLNVSIKPIELQSYTGLRQKKETLYLQDSPPTHTSFVCGTEVDMETASELVIGDGNPLRWHDCFDIGFCLLKMVTGVEGIMDVLDSGIQVVAGKEEWLDALITVAAPAPIEILFTLPEIGNLADQYSQAAEAIRATQTDLKKIGYAPLAADLHKIPLWVHPGEGKLALIDPSGIVHPVKRAPHFHLVWPTCEIRRLTPPGHSIRLTWTETPGRERWVQVPTFGEIHTKTVLQPPPGAYKPIRLELFYESGMGGLGQPRPPQKQAELILLTHKGGILNLTRGVHKHAIIELGWQDRDPELFYRQPYIALLEGTLKIEDDSGPVGIAFVTKEGSSVQPAVWLQPEGTKYTVSVDPEKKQFSAEVSEGTVHILSADRQPVESITAGQSGIFFIEDSANSPDATPRIRRQEQNRQEKPDTELMQSEPPVQETTTPSPENTVLLYDSFDQENKGKGNLHFRGFQNWYIPQGEMDLVGNGFRHSIPQRGLFINLHGTPFGNEGRKAGSILSKKNFLLQPGRYQVTFLAAGLRCGKAASLSVDLAGQEKTITIPLSGREIEFIPATLMFEFEQPATGPLRIRSLSSPQADVLMDEIILTAFP